MGDQQIHTERLFGRRGQDSPAEPARGLKAYLPNAMTITRVLLALVFPFLPGNLRLAALIMATLTEWLDGALSRLWGVESDFGRMLDPVADKLFVLSMLGTFLWEGWISLPVAAVVLLRDLTVFVACTSILFFGDRSELGRLNPRILGKLATVAQFAFLLLVLLWRGAPSWLVVLTGALSAAAAIDYIFDYFRGVRPHTAAP